MLYSERKKERKNLMWKKETEEKEHVTYQRKKSKEVCGNLLSFLLRCGTRPYERGTLWDSNSLL